MLVDACPARTFDIVICGTSPQTLPAPLAAQGVRYCELRLAPSIAGMEGAGYISSATYIRLALPSVFEGSYSRILYLDADILIKSGTIQSLFDVDLKGKSLGAVRNTHQWRRANRSTEEFKRQGLAPAPYFNAGVMLIDVKAWIAQSVTERALQLHQTNLDCPFQYHDQSLLNLVLYKDWAELSPVWNWQYSWKFDFLMIRVCPHVVHFVGKIKAWHDHPNILPSQRRRFGMLLARFFPEHPNSGGSEHSKSMNWLGLLKICIKNLAAAPGVVHYLNRFPTDLTVHTYDQT